MALHRFVGLAAACSVLAGAHVAFAQNTVTLFGQSYRVQRFDYSEMVQLPNITFPMDPTIPFIESEGVSWVGNNKLIMTADDIFDVAPGNPDNWIVEVNVLVNGSGEVTGLSLSRTITVLDATTQGFDLNPSGITVNTGTTGLGAGGQMVVSNGAGNLISYSFTNGQLQAVTGGTCPTGPGACRLAMRSSNTNLEDVVYVPELGARPAQFYAINQDTSEVQRWAVVPSAVAPVTGVDGVLLGTFPVGQAIPTGPALLAPKGVTYLPNATTVPSAIRRAGGTIVVAFDDLYPALQAFDTDGQLIATEFLTTNGLASGASRLDLTGCPDPLQLESLTIDPTTGRLFLVNQGALTLCNYMYVLTPVPSCRADIDGNGVVGVPDIFLFLSLWFSGDARADINGNGSNGVDDIFAFLALWFAGC